MTLHSFYEGREEQEICCSRCGCSFWIRDPNCDDAEWEDAMSNWEVDKDCDAQLVKQVVES